jgi:uncharacterized caspase-like protein
MAMPSLGVLFRVAALASCAVLLAACAATPGSQSRTKLALVIGNAAYENVPALSNPANDAADMCAALRRVGFTTLCHTNVGDRATFEAHVKNYVEQLGPNTVGVFYYSGHGVQASSANFLIPTQVQPKTATEDPLRVLYGLDDLFGSLRQKQTRFQLVILDACRTDLFAGGRGPDAAKGTSLVRSLETVAHASYGLAPIQDAPSGTMVLYATASKEAAFDGEGRNGPLTKHILQHIGTRGLPVEEFIKRVTSGVENETMRDYRRRQTPFIYGSFSGKFCFAGCPGESSVPPAY